MTKNKKQEETPRSRKKQKLDKQKKPNPDDDYESDISECDKFSDDEEGGIRIDDIYIPPAPPPACTYESIGPRLIITHIVNENFKSYAGRVVVGPFDKSFSSIVGPNGSGKSNVIDSMLFVFGYRATKIRSKKVSVLIHKSEQFQHVPSCKVEVHFAQILDKDNGEYEKIPGSEFVIARTAFQNSSSFYELNNKKVQFKEVALNLRKHGIDLIHNRFLILQGEVEQIALMKPKAQTPHETGMLEYLEDIIGTTRFKEPIEKLQARIEQLNEERQEKLNRLKVVQSERDALKGPMEETVNYLKTENRITQLKNKKFQIQLHKIQKSVDATEAERKEIAENLKKLTDELEKIHDQRGAEKSEMDDLNKKAKKKMKKYEEITEMLKNCEKQGTSLEEEYKQLKKNAKKTAETLKTEEDKLKNLLKIPQKNQDEIKKLTAEEAVLNEKRKEEEVAFQAVMSSLQEETKGFQEEKDKLQAEQIKVKKVFDDMRSAYELAKSERDIYLSNEQNEKLKLSQLEEGLRKLSETLTSRTSELTALQENLPAKEAELRKAEEEALASKTKESNIVRELRQYQAQLEEKKCSMSANRSRSRVLDFLMQQKLEGHIPGIFGRLGDLGAIDEKYDIAISTACSSLDFILVDHSDTIAPCIETLKRNNVGRATFLALNKIAHHYNRRNPNFRAPENVPRLFDLIRVQDERVRPAFYYALRDTLVAENLEQATRIAYGSTRYRVVTLNGELIEISGTMSGGGRQVMRGKMGSSVTVSTDTGSAEEVNQLERSVSRLEEQLEQIRGAEHRSEEVISRNGPEIKVMKMNVNKLTIEIEGLKKQEPELKNQVVNQKKKVKEAAPNEKEVKKLTTKVEVAEKGSKKAETEAKAIEEKVNVVHQKIMDITGGKTKEAQKKLDEVTKQWEKTRSTITQLQVAIKTAERNAKKAEERIENMKAELEEAQKREGEIKSEKETLENDSKTMTESSTTLKEEIDEMTARLSVLQEEHKKFLQEVNNMKSTKVLEEQKLEAIEKKMKDTKRDIPVIEEKMAKLSLHKIPVFREPEDEMEQEEKSGETEENAETEKEPAAEKSDNHDELVKYDAEVLEEASVSDINELLKKEDEYIKTLTLNLNTLNDYEKKTQQYIERTTELKEITDRRNRCRAGYEEARKNRRQDFMAGFHIISNKLKELYQMLTMGGDAELDLHDSLDPFTEGINFCVRPPKKSWKNITNLSGGEKTLSSLALVFALHYYRPTPLYVMDEIDAALDFKNVSIVGYYIKDRTKNAQFIVISLRTNMFELANALTGIYKTYNCTKTVTIRPGDLGKKVETVPSIETDKPSQGSVQSNSNSNNNVAEERKRKVNKRLANIEKSTPSLNSDGAQTQTPAEKRSPLSQQHAAQSHGRDLDISAIDEDSDESAVLRAHAEREAAAKKQKPKAKNLDMSAIDEDSDDSVILAAARKQTAKNENAAGGSRGKKTTRSKDLDMSAIDDDSGDSSLLREHERRERTREKKDKGKSPADSTGMSSEDVDLSAIEQDSEEESVAATAAHKRKEDCMSSKRKKPTAKELERLAIENDSDETRSEREYQEDIAGLEQDSGNEGSVVSTRRGDQRKKEDQRKITAAGKSGGRTKENSVESDKENENTTNLDYEIEESSSKSSSETLIQ